MTVQCRHQGVQTERAESEGARVHKALSEGTTKGAAARRIKARVTQQEAVTVADAMRRVQPKHKGYVLARASGMSPADAWTETQTNALQPERSGRRLEESPIIKAAIARSEEVVLRGSLMSAWLTCKTPGATS